MTNSKATYSELELIDALVFKTCGLELTNVEKELESQEYFAHTFLLGGQKVIFRNAKITPTKKGQFVTIWKRSKKGITEPYAISDDFDLFIIAVRQNENFGLFIFSKNVLYENKILSSETREGKRGIRVYPTWDLAPNKQAERTQIWQTKYFLEIKPNLSLNVKSAKHLFNLNR
ncbi:MepB family protein [Flavobacterium sp. H122]|uniref:MepB family protein n=1 Tax=Flavobacterium sp. H122 TaxID=2529860 RepID=UPI0010AB1703|nr:MepB family protein [Flavobacterium sp. H122]